MTTSAAAKKRIIISSPPFFFGSFEFSEGVVGKSAPDGSQGDDTQF